MNFPSPADVYKNSHSDLAMLLAKTKISEHLYMDLYLLFNVIQNYNRSFTSQSLFTDTIKILNYFFFNNLVRILRIVFLMLEAPGGWRT